MENNWKDHPVWDKLAKAANNLGVTDIWGQFTPFNDDELDRIIRCQEVYSMAKCAFDTHGANQVRIEEHYYNREFIIRTVGNIVDSCEKAAFARYTSEQVKSFAK